MTRTKSLMRDEILEIPAAVARLLDQGGPAIREAAAAARQLDPAFIATVARGSSDQACSFLKYAFEIARGLPVASIGPSVASIYKAPLKLNGALCIAVDCQLVRQRRLRAARFRAARGRLGGDGEARNAASRRMITTPARRGNRRAAKGGRPHRPSRWCGWV